MVVCSDVMGKICTIQETNQNSPFHASQARIAINSFNLNFFFCNFVFIKAYVTMEV